MPFEIPNINLDKQISELVIFNILCKKQVLAYRLLEPHFSLSPLLAFEGTALKDRVVAYLNFENAQLTQVLINEAITNELIFEVYELSDEDR
jgi:hypothetical protein